MSLFQRRKQRSRERQKRNVLSVSSHVFVYNELCGPLMICTSARHDESRGGQGWSQAPSHAIPRMRKD